MIIDEKYLTSNVMKYRDSSEIKKSTEEIEDYYKEKRSWGIREGKVFEWLKSVPKHGTVVEIGAGSGALASGLAEHGFDNLHLVDIQNYVQANLGAALKSFSVCDVSNDPLPFPDGSADAVVALQTFEHLENIWHAVREIHRVLKRGGVLVFSIPYIFSARSRFKFLLFGKVEAYRLDNDHISVLPHGVFEKLFFPKFTVDRVAYARPYIKIPALRRKIRLPDGFLGKYFSSDVAYIMRKK